jgi:NTP pyrophosphatase (non-canonical NTP hydrolase)
MIYKNGISFIAGFYGEENQLIQTAEESAELAKAVIKRYKALTGQADNSLDVLSLTRAALIEEIADVLIMVEQIVYIEGIETDVRRIIDEKIDRQIARIKQTAKKGQAT